MKVLGNDLMKSVLFRADGSKEIGMGHVTRDIDVAKCLREHYDPIYFLTKDNPSVLDYITKNGFKTLIFPKDSYKETNTRIEKLLEEMHFDDIILDLYSIQQSDVDFYKKFCNRVICFTDETYKLEIVADMIFAFSPNQRAEFYINIPEGKFHIGLKYEPLNPIFSNKRSEAKEKIERILVTMGGSDRNDLTRRVLNILLELNYQFEITAILGAGSGELNPDTVNRCRKQSITLKKNVKNMYNEMLKTDMGICAAGNTLVEFMSLGIPTLVLPQTKRENEHANAYKKKGAILKVPNYGDKIKEENIFKLLMKLIYNADLRKEISKNALEIVDGKGVYRIVDILLDKEGG
jgi:UDP-2,4-diacetamido-2,4,6-trideoxy-beta-L-altropyranose hydrolase